MVNLVHSEPSVLTLSILLVEDDEDDYILTRDLLDEMPGIRARVEWATSPVEGLARLAEQRPDLCLVDYRLGEQTGLEFLAEVRQRGEHLPIILLTGQNSYEIDMAALRAGANDFLVKGQFDVGTLARAIRYALERQRAEEEIRSLNAELEARVRQRTVELEAQRRLLAAVLDTAPVGLAFYDATGTLVNANPAWQRMAGTGALTSLIPPPDPLSTHPEYATLQARVLAGEPVDLSNAPYHAPGSEKEYYYDILLRPLVAPDGTVTGMLSALVDVTGRAELDKQKNEFLSIASHELKTPITSIKAYAQMAMRQGDSGAADRLARSLSIVDRQADRLVSLIEELLDVSRLQEGQLPLHVEPFDLAALLRDVVETTRLGAPDFAIRLDTPPAPVQVAADAGRIEQVAINLLQNAIKYSGESREVEVRLTHTATEAVTAVRDYGVGIPVAQQAHVFERYFRASNVSARNYSGLGLGLYITHGLVQRHGGRMWLDSAEGQGSTFYFALPLARE